MKKIGLVYVPFFDKGHLPKITEAWKSIDAKNRDSIKIYIIPADNPDGILKDIKENILPISGSEIPEVELLDDGINHGFAGNHNRGIRKAIDDGCDHIVLQNGDAYFESGAIEKMSNFLDEHQDAGSVQALVKYWNEKNKVNVAGGAFHIAGYGFAIDNGKEDKGQYRVTELSYSSGAAVMFRSETLKEVGLLEEGFFMYHEDLELGLRIRIAGKKNYLLPSAVAYHDYKFSKNPKKFSWMELYRWVVVLGYYRLPTLILIAPIMLGVELASWFFAVKNGWLKAKIYQYANFFLPKTWQLIIKIRARQKQLRKISDREFMSMTVGELLGQEADNAIVEKIANPLLSTWVKLLKLIIVW